MSSTPSARPDDAVEEETEESLRPLLFSIAYRMTGSAGDSEDLAQEALLRLHTSEAAGDDIRSRKAFSTTIVTRLALDYLRSARVRRERYVGQWLPEPLVADRGDGPEERAELADSLSMAFLVLLESLSPPERAVFLLHDVLGYSYHDAAEVIGRSEVNARQIASRARRAIHARRPRFETTTEAKWELAGRFFAVVESGDVDALVSMLSDDAMMYGDGGGVVPTRAEPISSPRAIAAMLVGLAARLARDGLRIVEVEVNGEPGVAISDGSATPHAVVALDIVGDKVRTVSSVLNPAKLPHLEWISER
jgi:RNA polymerase sigma-70 factor, ECF subfamily